MGNDREESSQPEDGERENLEDLDIRPDEVDKVKGGRRGDPCDGGEVTPPRPGEN